MGKFIEECYYGNLDSFIIGFRLGADFTYDTFVSDEAPFERSKTTPQSYL